jgi:putative membrane protein
MALTDRAVHALQHASFLAAALCFWWALRPRPGLDSLGRTLACLFVTMIGTGALGALLAFAATPWYAAYDEAVSALGMSALEEQQVGGLIMWIPGGTVFLVVALLRMLRALAPANAPAVPRFVPPPRLVQ